MTDHEPIQDPFDVHDTVYEHWVPPEVEPKIERFESEDGLSLAYLDWPADEGAPTLDLLGHPIERAHDLD